jgi:hypothetical protein
MAIRKDRWQGQSVGEFRKGGKQEDDTIERSLSVVSSDGGFDVAKKGRPALVEERKEMEGAMKSGGEEIRKKRWGVGPTVRS